MDLFIDIIVYLLIFGVTFYLGYSSPKAPKPFMDREDRQDLNIALMKLDMLKVSGDLKAGEISQVEDITERLQEIYMKY